MNVFSANSLNLFLKSKKDFYEVYVLKIPSLYLENYAQSGKNLHAVLSYKLKGQNIKKFENVLNEKEKKYLKNALENEVLKLKPINVEHSFLVRIENFWLVGRFDAVFRDEEKIIVVDWKTGKIPGGNDMQTLVYLYCASKLYKEKNVCVTYFSLSDGSTKTFDNIENCEQLILNVIKKIEKHLK